MFVPESMKKEAMRAVKKKIKEEIIANLSISCSIEKTYDGDHGASVSVELYYDGEIVAEDNDHVYFSWQPIGSMK